MKIPAPPPGRAFDNLYFVGSKWVSTWAITTSDGIILIDAIDNEEEAERIVEAGLKSLGLDPTKVKTVIVTHGHGDHYGGANFFAQKYQSRIVASDVDWTMMETKLEFDTPLWGRPPKHDVSVVDGDEVTLGDTTIDILITPGHTMGTISPIFGVRSGSRSVARCCGAGPHSISVKSPNVCKPISTRPRARARSRSNRTSMSSFRTTICMTAPLISLRRKPPTGRTHLCSGHQPFNAP
jgi:metallo-beta-lactamase class B